MAFLVSTTKKRDRKNNTNQQVNDAEVLEVLNNIKEEIDIANQSLNYAVSKELIDSSIYEIKSLQLKYQYYLKICKKRGLRHISIKEHNEML